MKDVLRAAGAIAALALAACTAGQTGPPPVTSVNPVNPNVSVLQFAVGTLNVAGTAKGMNVVATLRQQNGLSAVGVGTPTLAGPFTLPAPGGSPGSFGETIATGPSPSEARVAGAPAIPSCGGRICIAGTPQQTPGTPVSSYPYDTTFGIAGNVSNNGFFPINYDTTGNPASFAPFAVPFYAETGVDGSNLPTSFVPFGGPPAYDPNGDGKGTRDGTFATTSGILGINLGLSAFAGAIPHAGTYALSVNVPTGSGSAGTLAATAKLAAPVFLPTIAPPTIALPGDGSATVSYVIPSGVRGALVEVVDQGAQSSSGSPNPPQSLGAAFAADGCQTPVYYTFWVTKAGPGSVKVTNAMAPGKPGSIGTAVCPASANATTGVGDTVQAWIVGYDYDAYDLSFNKPSGTQYPQKPELPARADVTISAPANATSP